MGFFIVLGLIIIALIALILTNIRVVPQSKAYVIERLGTYFGTWDTGIHVKIPFVDRIAKIISLKEQVVDFLGDYTHLPDNLVCVSGLFFWLNIFFYQRSCDYESDNGNGCKYHNLYSRLNVKQCRNKTCYRAYHKPYGNHLRSSGFNHSGHDNHYCPNDTKRSLNILNHF